MTDVATASPQGSSKKGGAKSKKPRAKPNHPRTSDMVTSAIKNLNERGGSSLQAIKKYIASNYKVDAEKLAPFIKKYLKSAVLAGSLVQTKGKGATGSFKISGGGKEKPAVVKKAAPKAAKKAVEKKPKSGKKAAVSPKKAKKAAPKAAAKKSPAKAKKSPAKATKAKSPKKPKTPKPKKAAAKKTTKKASPKKK